MDKMTQMGHVLIVLEPAKGVGNGCMIHNMKPLDVRSSMLKPKKIQKLDFAYL